MREHIFDFASYLVIQLGLLFSALVGYVYTQTPQFDDVPYWYKLVSVFIGVTVTQSAVFAVDRFSQTTIRGQNGNDPA